MNWNESSIGSSVYERSKCERGPIYLITVTSVTRVQKKRPQEYRFMVHSRVGYDIEI